MVQLSELAASSAFCCMLMAAPVPSTGVVATSPSGKRATAPLAKELAGATAAAEPAAGALALAVGAGVPPVVGVADAPGWRCRPKADWLIDVACPLFDTAMKIPRATPSATGMARGTATRAARLRWLRRRVTDRCPVSIKSTSMSVVTLPGHHVRPARTGYPRNRKYSPCSRPGRFPEENIAYS